MNAITDRQYRRKGFTLIELLVVISIISILASVILVSLRESRSKAQNAKIVSQLIQMRSVAELTHSGLGYYGVATSNNNCGNMFASTGFESVGNWPMIDGVNTVPVCYSNANNGENITAYSIWYALHNSTGWCVDSTGYSAFLMNAPGASSCTGVSDGGTLANGELCQEHVDCASGICGYINPGGDFEASLQCTDGVAGVYCEDNSQCASNLCDINQLTCN